MRVLRSPIAALALLLVSPGLAGVVLDAAHPCPAKAPWLLQAANGHHGSDHAPADAPADEHDCKCFGSCLNAPQVRAVTAVSDFGFVSLVATSVPRPPYSAFMPVGQPADRLPPATAPPRV